MAGRIAVAGSEGSRRGSNRSGSSQGLRGVVGVGLREWAEVFATPRLADPRALRSEMPQIVEHVDDPPEIGPEDARRVLTVHMPVFGPDRRVALTFNLGSFGSVELEKLNEMIARLRESADRVTELLGGQRPE